MITWKHYLLEQRQHGGYLGIAAKLVLDSASGATPETMRKRAEKLTDTATWIERINDLEEAWGSCVTVNTSAGDWNDLPNGGHIRRNHVHGAA